MKIGIKEGKIYDICSELMNKRDNSIPGKDYIDKPYDGERIEDTWNYESNISLKDSPQRSEEPPKSELELKIEVMGERIAKLEKKK